MINSHSTFNCDPCVHGSMCAIQFLTMRIQNLFLLYYYRKLHLAFLWSNNVKCPGQNNTPIDVPNITHCFMIMLFISCSISCILHLILSLGFDVRCQVTYLVRRWQINIYDVECIDKTANNNNNIGTLFMEDDAKRNWMFAIVVVGKVTEKSCWYV